MQGNAQCGAHDNNEPREDKIAHAHEAQSTRKQQHHAPFDARDSSVEVLSANVDESHFFEHTQWAVRLIVCEVSKQLKPQLFHEHCVGPAAGPRQKPQQHPTLSAFSWVPRRDNGTTQRVTIIALRRTSILEHIHQV